MRRHQLSKFVVVAVLAALMGACQPPLTIKLASAEERLPAPAFVISEPSQPGGQPRYDHISVMDVDGTLMWTARSLPPRTGPFPARINYGVLPMNFETLDSPKPLIPGRTYHLAVAGEARGGYHFHVDANGTIREAR